MGRERVKVALIGVGNCASSLVQGISYYREKRGLKDQQPPVGLMHETIGSYHATDIEVVAAFDIDRRKVGVRLGEAIFAAPNNTQVFFPKPITDSVTVTMGKMLDGYSPHLSEYSEEKTIAPASFAEPSQEDIVRILRSTGANVMVNYLPVGSDNATKFYAECAIKAGLGFVNCIPVFIASDPSWAARFRQHGLPVIGDDVKSQVGATILHRALAKLFESRGVEITSTYQLNVGGNTDFLNMLNRQRLASKKVSKTEAVRSLLQQQIEDDFIHIGPSDYVPWMRDNKVAFIRVEGKGFGGVPINVDVRLSVEDSPNSSGVVIDAIRCCMLGLDRKLAGPLNAPCSYLMKHPPQQIPDPVAHEELDAFIAPSRAVEVEQ